MLIAGMDEAGRGSLISRVYVAICVLPEDFVAICQENKVVIRDSKKMSKRQRDRARLLIEQYAIDYNVQYREHDTIDKVGIGKATMDAMHSCVDHLQLPIDRLLVDGNYYHNHRYDIFSECVVRGDDIHPEIACASILAKTYRDEYVSNLVDTFPHILTRYGISSNMGYGTKIHMDAIEKYGFSPFHRKSFCKRNLLL